MNLNLGEAFAFVFEDDNWVVKILLAAAILLLGIAFSWVLAIPLIIAGLLLSGYSVEITRMVIQGDSRRLPEWDNWVDLLMDGLRVFVIGIVYALPLILASICLSIPTSIFAEDSEGLSAFFGLIMGCFNFLWGIALSLVLPAAIGHWVAKDDLGAAFRFGEVIGLVRDNFVTYLITLLMSWVASIIGGLGFLVCGVGWLVTGPYSIMVTGHLYGQAYLDATGGAVAPIDPDLDAIEAAA